MNSNQLHVWQPEDGVFWQEHGKRIASRNLWISILALLLAFAVWMVWSLVVVTLPNVGFKFDTNQLFWLAALPGLSGATLRIFYSFMVPIFGGRVWTTVSTASLLVPAIGIGFAVQDPTTPYSTMLVLALLCGLGGGNFASSMANIGFFFPKAHKGMALAMNAGLGNLGVSVMQFVVPLALTVSVFGAIGGEPQTWIKDGVTKLMWLQNAGFIWVPFILLATLAAWVGMHDIVSAKASFSEQAVIFKRKHNWLISWLYLGTFGSFIGYSAGFPLLIKTQFPDVDAMQYAFLGPLVGAVSRVVGGWVSDKLGGAVVTFWVFVVMTGAAFGVMAFLPHAGVGGDFRMFFTMFMILFGASGVGNAAVFRMIPAIFLTHHERMGTAKSDVFRHANREAAGVLGFSSAFAAYGAFLVPKGFGSALDMTGYPDPAFWGFIAFYVSCLALTWWYYSRKGAEMPC